ncbi:MAG: carboxynorspermidine decarboxylase [Oscillospiraceae bacterium]|nr:carboxynorspermidine decarboxylase [Oscillospiraceae bacterium]
MTRDQLYEIPTPAYVVDKDKIIKNLETLEFVQRQTGCRVLLAQKAFSMFRLYPLMSKYLAGTTASGLYEAKLGREYMGGETHVFSPAYPEGDFDELAAICDCIVFNSFGQLNKFKAKVQNKRLGLRVNPEYSEISREIYDPCAKYSRLGVTLRTIQKNSQDLKYIDGLHFHTMCEQDSDVLRRALLVFEAKFGEFLELENIKWVNFGGGQHITREGYDTKTLIDSITLIRDKYGLEVYLEPGEAVALDAGVLVSTVLDITDDEELPCAILDASAACHMPDVLEMPYRPEVFGAGLPGQKKHTCRLGGNTCLAGDIIGDYSFDKKLKNGDKIVFSDMAHYTMVKNNTFNGAKLPSILLLANGKIETVREFGYGDFKTRLS